MADRGSTPTREPADAQPKDADGAGSVGAGSGDAPGADNVSLSDIAAEDDIGMAFAAAVGAPQAPMSGADQAEADRAEAVVALAALEAASDDGDGEGARGERGSSSVPVDRLAAAEAATVPDAFPRHGPIDVDDDPAPTALTVADASADAGDATRGATQADGTLEAKVDGGTTAEADAEADGPVLVPSPATGSDADEVSRDRVPTTPTDPSEDSLADSAPATEDPASVRARLRSRCGWGGSLSDFGILGGVGIESFFRIVLSCIRVFIVCTILAAPLLINNWIRASKDNRFLQGTLNFPVAKDGSENTYALYSGIALAQFVAIMIFLVVVPWSVQRTVRKADIMRTTPSDFTIRVKAVPRGVREADLAEFFSTWGNVVLTTIVRKTERLRRARAALAKLTLPQEGDRPMCCGGRCPKPSCMRGSPRDEYQAALASYNKIKARREKALQDAERAGASNSGTAFVVFDSEHSQVECVDLMSRTPVDTLLRWVRTCTYAVKPRLKLPGSDTRVGLVVDRAPEPSNIHWDNAELSWWTGMRRYLFAWVIMAALVAVSFVAVVLITNEEQNSTTNSAILSYLPPIVILCINQLMKLAARRLAMWERHATYEGEQVSQLVKIAISQCLNSVVILIVVYWKDKQKWFLVSEDTLGSKALFLVLLNTFVPSAANFAFWGFMRFFKNYIRDPLFEAIGLPVPKEKKLTPQLSMWYAAIIKTFAMGMLFGPVAPAVYPLSLISFVILYWQYRHTYLLFQLEFPSFNSRISNAAMNIVTVFGIFYVLVSVVIATGVRSRYSGIFAIVAFVLWALKICLPVHWVEKLAWKLSGAERAMVQEKLRLERLSASRSSIDPKLILLYKSKVDELAAVATNTGVAQARFDMGQSANLHQSHGAVALYRGFGAGMVMCCSCCKTWVQPAPLAKRDLRAAVGSTDPDDPEFDVAAAIQIGSRPVHPADMVPKP